MPDFNQISRHINQYKEEGKKLFVSSSFQTHSLPLLHMLSRIDKDIPVVFLQTGFHFPETITFRDEVLQLLGMQMIELRSTTPPVMQLNDKGRLLYTSDPDYCCYLNKIAPMEPMLAAYDIWINGVRGDQNANRSTFSLEQPTHSRAVRYHPIIDWDGKQIYQYINEFNLPRHPLDDKGYISVGCEPCTRKFDAAMLNDERGSRWFGMQKTECGLHTELIQQP
ncbi:MAG: phosphoadenosine phosphosulfate reductase [Sphingobacteriales bacterium BACL12 MAG-120813-bin55]|jgi:phosphoadenosine phosphosulfate reductase|nr:MAG: phosphoadenosine phosphosulfate reductase [Sphingobacteriales bacterium BACL12 MAG-120813-bin55]KRP09644.1 MAG: phosphoadenosine phosphosulfate reductase [Sphingobacteriales bacterium BACL12 MAG-120802-bin5]